MASPDVRVRLSAEGVQEVVGALKKIQAESSRSGGRAAQGFTGLNSVLASTSKLLGTVGVGLSALTLIRFGRQAVTELKQFETGFAEVRTIMSATDAEAEQVRRRLLDLASVRPQDQSLLAKGLYQTISSGITDTGKALEFLSTAARAAVAGVTETSVAVDVGTTILNAYGLKARDADRIFDILFTTVREGKLTFEEIGSSIGTAIPTFAQVGIGVDQLAAAMATLTKGGLNAEIASTALRAALLQVVKPADEARTLAQDLGLSFDAQTVASKGLVPWLKEVQEKTHGNAEAIATLFPNVRGLNAILALSGNQWEEYSRILDVVQNQSAGAAQSAFDLMNNTMENQDKILRNKLKNAWLSLGESISGVAKSAAASLGSLLPKTFEEQADELSRLEREIQRVEGRGLSLANAYDRLVETSDGGEESQRKVTAAMQELAREFPEVITQMDQYGNVIDITTDRLRKYRLEVEANLDRESRQTFLEQANNAIRLAKSLDQTRTAFNRVIDAEERVAKGGLVTVGSIFSDLPLATGRRIASSSDELLNTDTVESQRQKLVRAVSKLQSDLVAAQQKVAQTILDGGLAPFVVQFEQLARAVESGSRPADDLQNAIRNLDYRFIALFDTADPAEIRTRMREIADSLRQLDPSLFDYGSDFVGPLPENAFPFVGPTEEMIEAGKKSAGVVRALLAKEAALAQANAKLRNDEEKRLYEEGLITAQEYYNNRRQIAEGEIAAEIAALQEQRKAATDEPKQIAIDTQILQKRIELQGKLAAITGEELQAIRATEAAKLALEEKILEAQGNRHAAALLAIDQEIHALREQGAEESKLDELRSARTTTADFEESQRQARLALGELSASRARTQALVDAGLLSQIEGENRILAIEQARLPVLQELAARLYAAAVATGNAEQIAQAQEFKDALIGVGVAAKETKKQLSAAGEIAASGLEAFFQTGISGANGLAGAFSATANSIINDLNRIASHSLAQSLFSLISSTASSGGQAGTELPIGGSEPILAATGGQFKGPGTGVSDSIPAWVSNDEYLVRSAVVRQPGVLQHLHALNRMGSVALRAYADGGLVGGGAGRGAVTETPRDGRLVVEHSEDTIIRVLESPRGQKIHLQNTNRNKRATNAILQGR